jgi:hypothetical protein
MVRRTRGPGTTPLVLAAAVLMPLAGCGPGSGTAGSGPATTEERQHSGVTGVSLVDGGCPTVPVGEVCPDAPMLAHLTVTGADSSVVASVDTGSDGSFRIPLSPGTYTMTPTNTSGAPLPYSEPISFEVREREFTTITVRFDSGVR